MLNNRDGVRIAVVVNDMASVNVDAELVRQGGGIVQQQEAMVELSNGCICCTLREDLLTSLSSLAAEQRFDHVCSSSRRASPSRSLSPRPSPSAIVPLASRWTTLPLSPTWSPLSTLRLSSSSSARWKRSWTAAGRRPKATSAPCHTCSSSPDLLLLNKRDLVTEEQLGAVEAFLRKANPTAEVVPARRASA